MKGKGYTANFYIKTKNGADNKQYILLTQNVPNNLLIYELISFKVKNMKTMKLIKYIHFAKKNKNNGETCTYPSEHS